MRTLTAKVVMMSLIAVLLFACKKQEGCVVLSPDYRLWIVSAQERMITDAMDKYLLGPKVSELSVANGVIAGFNPAHQYLDYENKVGFFIIDTDASSFSVELSEQEFKTSLEQYADLNLELIGSGEVFSKRRKSHSCH